MTKGQGEGETLVFVVDDDASMRQALTSLLQSVGLRVEAFSSAVHPFPPDVDPSDYEACKAHVARCPAWVLAAAVLAWGLTTFASAWLATRLGPGRHRAHGVVVGLVLLALVVMNMSMLPYPI